MSLALSIAAMTVYAADETQLVDPKPKSVSNEGDKAGKIDYGEGQTGDASATAAQSIVKNDDTITVTSKIFTPPAGKKFVPLPAKLPNGKDTYVDVWKLPEGTAVVLLKNDSGGVQIKCTFPAASAGEFPLAAEGNIAGVGGTTSSSPGGTSEGLHWSAKVGNQKFDLIVCNGQDGPEVSEEKEETVGAFSVANLNDTDGDGRVDREETGADVNNQIAGEKDMIKVIIKKVTDETIAGSVKLEMTGDGTKVKLWKKQTKEGGVEDARSWTIAEIPDGGLVRWIEGLDKSASVRDITVTLKKSGEGGGFSDGQELDKAKLTFVWATRTGAEFNRKTAAQLLAGDAWKNMTKPPKDWFTGNPPDSDGTGLLPLNAAGDMQNGMVMKFKIEPANVWKEPGVKFDISRQMVGKMWYKDGKGWHLGSQKQDPGDDETANDDSADDDESEAPNGDGEMFVEDAPGIGGGLPAGITNFVARGNFREFVRVSFDGTKPAGDKKVGSRCSNKYIWHVCHSWTNNNGWARDNGANLDEIVDGGPEITIGNNP